MSVSFVPAIHEAAAVLPILVPVPEVLESLGFGEVGVLLARLDVKQLSLSGAAGLMFCGIRYWLFRALVFGARCVSGEVPGADGVLFCASTNSLTAPC